MINERHISHGTIAVLVLIATAIIFVFHTVPANREKDVLASKNNEVSQQLAELERKASGKSDALGISEVALQELQKAIPQTLAQDQLILDISKIAKQANVSFNALTFSLGASQQGLTTISVAGGFEAPPARLLDFVKKLETNARKLVIRSASVSQSVVVDGEQFATLTLTLEAFSEALSNVIQ